MVRHSSTASKYSWIEGWYKRPRGERFWKIWLATRGSSLESSLDRFEAPERWKGEGRAWTGIGGSLLFSALSWRRLTFIQLNLSRQPLFNGRISRPMGRDAASVDNWTFQWLAATSNNGIRTRIHLISRNRGRWWHEGYRDWRFRRDETSSLYTDSSVWKAWIRDGFCGRWMM